MRGRQPRRTGPYELGQIPVFALVEIGKQIVHRLALGQKDISGDDFGTFFANAIGGVHRATPLGIADVVWGGCAWSLKTVKASKPFSAPRVRLISGRNSPDFSQGISDPRANAEVTGHAVLSIWNARVNEAMNRHDDLRVGVLVRNMSTREFTLFEEEAQRFVQSNYEWEFNKRGNLEGREKSTNVHRFTWQPHGSQFTVIREVPSSARSFSIGPEVPRLDPESVLSQIKFEESWIKIQD